MRRTAILSILMLALAAIAPARAQETTPTLKDVYRDAFLMGCAVNTSIVNGRDRTGQELVLKEFNSISPENDLKPESINPRPGVYRWGPADAYVEFGEKHHMFIIGHTLIWHNQTPDFFFQDADGKPKSKEALVEQMKSHIQAVAGRYAGRINGWDVVNEVIDNDGSYRQTSWVNGFGGDGDELVRDAFKFAHEAAPDAELYYNDFNAWRPAKRDGIVRMVKMLQANNIKIDGVGIQAHWGLDYPSDKDIEDAIDAYAALGVKVMITELDVDVLPISKEGQIIGRALQDPQFQLPEFEKFLDPYKQGLPAEVEQQLADRYAHLFGIFYKKRDKIARVTVWGANDRMSWKNDSPISRRTNYPLLFDRGYRPKPAFDAVLKVPGEN